MDPKINKAHFKFVYGLLLTPLNIPQSFYAKADLILYFFSRLDEQTTNRVIKQTKNANIAPSCFGETIILFSEQNSLVLDPIDPTGNEVIRKFAKDLFLNLAAWYILPLVAANKQICPYMPQGWIDAFIKKWTALSEEDRQRYLCDIRDFIKQSEPKWWIKPYEIAASQLDSEAKDKLILLMGIFLERCREQKNQEISSSLSPEIVQFLESISAIDKLPPSQ